MACILDIMLIVMCENNIDYKEMKVWQIGKSETNDVVSNKNVLTHFLKVTLKSIQHLTLKRPSAYAFIYMYMTSEK